VAEIRAKYAWNPPPDGEQMSWFTAQISDLPIEWQGLALQCLTAGYEFGFDMNASQKMKFQRESVVSAIGIILLLIGVGLPFLVRDMSAQQSMSCCFLMSLGAAGFLVFLPGFLVLQGALKPNEYLESLKFKGGGGAAIFLLVFLFLHFVLKY
jgi:hypothetical protein